MPLRGWSLPENDNATSTSSSWIAGSNRPRDPREDTGFQIGGISTAHLAMRAADAMSTKGAPPLIDHVSPLCRRPCSDRLRKVIDHRVTAMSAMLCSH
jgi:hypothetical protein